MKHIIYYTTPLYIIRSKNRLCRNISTNWEP